MCTGRFLFMHEERMPLGAASGGQQGAWNAAASATLRQHGMRSAWSGRRFCVVLPLQCTPCGTGRRNPLARTEMRSVVCQTCGDTGAVAVAITLGMHVSCVRCRLC